MRVGLVGTGHWARSVHGASLAASGALAGVYGRTPEHVATAARALDTVAFSDFDALLESVDAVSFAVPPPVQADLAVRAAEAGRHLLLDKPVALDPAGAHRIAEAAARAGVASTVFFTARYDPAVRSWLADAERKTWDGAYGHWISAALSAPDSPYLESAWRLEHGALWDITPHVLAVLIPVLGPVDGVRAIGAGRDLVHLVFHHLAGATSTASLTLHAPPAATSTGLTLWGGAGLSPMPERVLTAVECYAVMHRELADAVKRAGTHPCDAEFGAAVVDVVHAAAEELAAP